MIRSFYHHGAEQPASELTLEQMRAALADAGGLLWVDLTDPSPEETRKVLGDVFRFSTPQVEACVSEPSMRGVVDFGGHFLVAVHGASGNPPQQPVTTFATHCYVGRNFVVTYHTKPVPALERLAERVMEDELLMSQGAPRFACTLLHQIVGEMEQLLNVLSAAEAGLEVEVLTAPRADTLPRLLQLHRDVLKVEQALQLDASVLHELASRKLPNVSTDQQLHLRQLSERVRELLHSAARLRELGHCVLDGYHLVAVQELKRVLKRASAVGITLLAVLIAVSMGIAGLPEAMRGSLAEVVALLFPGLTVAVLLALLFHLRGWL